MEAQVPAFYTVTTASKHDSTIMSSIPYEPNSYYIFDKAYDIFKELYKIHLTGSYYVVRAKTNLKYKMVKWKRRMLYAYRLVLPLSLIVSWLLFFIICN
ncbi:hypothetical protein ACQRC7_03575 [Segatella copri]|uniref:hypothetical protein n=1 Tax=Segatella copri TaxID=165179 RepID=UPI003CFC8F03